MKVQVCRWPCNMTSDIAVSEHKSSIAAHKSNASGSISVRLRNDQAHMQALQLTRKYSQALQKY
jgi:hypothetical protein